MTIRETLQHEYATIEELIECFEIVRANGDVVMIKFDGLRERNHYTVLITFSNSQRELVRADTSTLREALIKVLTQYIS